MSKNPDVIVIGGGSAGSVVTRRLLDDGLSVHLLEAGGEDLNPAIHDLGRLGELWLGPEDWGYYTSPQEHAYGRRLHWPRGKVLGGSHSLNASIYVRGTKADYDGWAAEGNSGWAWNDVLPIFRRIENYSGGASELRGVGGLLDVTTDYPKSPIQTSFIEAAQQWGLPLNPDYNGESLDGVAQEQLNFRDGKRLSSFVAYLRPVIHNPALTLTTGAWVQRLIVENGSVTGVVYEVDGQLHELHAAEVVLCAGALDSPRILLLSGIGPAADLEALGIDVVLDAPGVGKNLHDHLLAPIVYRTTKRDVGPPPEFMPISQAHLFWRSRPGLDRPDTQPIAFSVPMPGENMPDLPATGFTLMGGLVTPKSRGTFTLSSADPYAPTIQNPNILEHPDDVASLVASVRQLREIGRQPALADAWGAEEVYPTTPIDDDAATEEWVRRQVSTYHHQVGTCRMGVDDLAVVGPRLGVHGLNGVRVADASIMPRVTNGNTNAPSIMIGEQAAAFIVSGGES